MRSHASPLPRLLALALVTATVTGCSSFKETHYFRQKVADGNTPESYNYFKLTVSGEAGFTSSRYASGYFDEAAVDEYFSEFSATKPKTSEEKANSADNSSKKAPASAPIEPISAKNEGKALVLMLSSNNDAIASAIGTMASNQDLLASVARIARKAEYDDAEISKLAAEEEATRQKNFRVGVAEKLGRLKTESVAANRNIIFLDIANLVSASLGANTRFTTVAEAEQWLRENRSELSK